MDLTWGQHHKKEAMTNTLCMIGNQRLNSSETQDKTKDDWEEKCQFLLMIYCYTHR